MTYTADDKKVLRLRKEIARLATESDALRQQLEGEKRASARIVAQNQEQGEELSEATDANQSLIAQLERLEENLDDSRKTTWQLRSQNRNLHTSVAELSRQVEDARHLTLDTLKAAWETAEPTTESPSRPSDLIIQRLDGEAYSVYRTGSGTPSGRHFRVLSRAPQPWEPLEDLSDEAVERAARVIYRSGGWAAWDHESEKIRDGYRRSARAVLDAAAGGDR